jgi:hypothetical protein
MSGSSARRKGHAYERLVSLYLREIDPSAKRNVSESQAGGYDIITELPLAIQCKCFSKWHVDPHTIWEQAKKHAGGKIPLGIVRITRKQPDLVIMSREDFWDILRKLYGKEKASCCNSCS